MVRHTQRFRERGAKRCPKANRGRMEDKFLRHITGSAALSKGASTPRINASSSLHVCTFTPEVPLASPAAQPNIWKGACIKQSWNKPAFCPTLHTSAQPHQKQLTAV
eukprot:359034-Chlamydomonas_euryale.AAC.3